jgi:acetyl esterase/lipase
MKSLPTPPDVSTLSIPAWRAALASRKAAFNATWVLPTDAMTISTSTVTARDGYEIPIRTYVPKSPPEGGSPLIVLFHGGGFCIGDMDAEEANARLWVTNYGAAVVNVEYRLAPEHRFPAAALDGWDVLVWVP